jgi:hypothetical protein
MFHSRGLGGVAILDAGGGDQHGQQQADGVDGDVPFPAVDLLARDIAAAVPSRAPAPALLPPRAGKAGSMTAHSASLISDGYRGIRVLRLIPPGQHRHATTGPPAGQCMAPRHACRVAWACAGPLLS